MRSSGTFWERRCTFFILLFAACFLEDMAPDVRLVTILEQTLLEIAHYFAVAVSMRYMHLFIPLATGCIRLMLY